VYRYMLFITCYMLHVKYRYYCIANNFGRAQRVNALCMNTKFGEAGVLEFWGADVAAGKGQTAETCQTTSERARVGQVFLY
jgi:hypothetical protein